MITYRRTACIAVGVMVVAACGSAPGERESGADDQTLPASEAEHCVGDGVQSLNPLVDTAEWVERWIRVEDAPSRLGVHDESGGLYERASFVGESVELSAASDTAIGAAVARVTEPATPLFMSPSELERLDVPSSYLFGLRWSDYYEAWFAWSVFEIGDDGSLIDVLDCGPVVGLDELRQAAKERGYSGSDVDLLAGTSVATLQGLSGEDSTEPPPDLDFSAIDGGQDALLLQFDAPREGEPYNYCLRQGSDVRCFASDAANNEPFSIEVKIDRSRPMELFVGDGTLQNAPTEQMAEIELAENAIGLHVGVGADGALVAIQSFER